MGKILSFLLLPLLATACLTGCGHDAPANTARAVSPEASATGLDTLLDKASQAPAEARPKVLSAIQNQIRLHGSPAQKDRYLKLGGQL